MGRTVDTAGFLSISPRQPPVGHGRVKLMRDNRAGSFSLRQMSACKGPGTGKTGERCKWSVDWEPRPDRRPVQNGWAIAVTGVRGRLPPVTNRARSLDFNELRALRSNDGMRRTRCPGMQHSEEPRTRSARAEVW